ncbi:hypothetical protein [Sporomusa termitida]|nr:hypothetical protein [Sporomusa termitida]
MPIRTFIPEQFFYPAAQKTVRVKMGDKQVSIISDSGLYMRKIGIAYE